jgi:uncharacterized protein YndB with AHSA1/START domain
MSVASAANSGTFKVTTPNDTDIVLTRLFDAPRQLVFDAITKPEHVRRWWGHLSEKHGVSVCEIDLRVGGAWRYVHYGPEGDYPAFYGTYQVIDPPNRLVNTEFFEPYPDAGSQVTVDLTEEDGKTRMTVTATYPSRDVRDAVVQSGMEKGAAISYDRLEDVLAAMPR